jgi:hydrogenase expression/formation protein HypD
VATAAIALTALPPNLSILSVHKYVPAAMEVVAQSERTNIEGYIAAGHAAAITGWGIFEPFAKETGCPVVVAGFEPLDILAAIAKLTELMGEKKPEVFNAYPRCVSKEGNLPALKTLWKVFHPVTGTWRGIAAVKDGNLDLREEWARIDARKRFTIDTSAVRDDKAAEEARGCRCGEIMLGLAVPTDCALFGQVCVPESPVGACMVSSEGQCRIWHTYGGAPNLRSVGS